MWKFALRGRAGDTGDTGVQGEQGIQGIQGEQGVPGDLSLVDRGDPAAYDFDTDDFIPSGNWRELDLSSIVPTGAIGVLMMLRFNSDYAYSEISFRKHGNSNDKNVGVLQQAFVDRMCVGNLFTFCDANRKVDYKLYPTTWNTLDVVVRGWYL